MKELTMCCVTWVILCVTGSAGEPGNCVARSRYKPSPGCKVISRAHRALRPRLRRCMHQSQGTPCAKFRKPDDDYASRFSKQLSEEDSIRNKLSAVWAFIPVEIAVDLLNFSTNRFTRHVISDQRAVEIVRAFVSSHAANKTEVPPDPSGLEVRLVFSAATWVRHEVIYTPSGRFTIDYNMRGKVDLKQYQQFVSELRSLVETKVGDVDGERRNNP